MGLSGLSFLDSAKGRRDKVSYLFDSGGFQFSQGTPDTGVHRPGCTRTPDLDCDLINTLFPCDNESKVDPVFVPALDVSVKHFKHSSFVSLPLYRDAGPCPPDTATWSEYTLTVWGTPPPHPFP